MSEHLGVKVTEKNAYDVRIGDSVVCMLSDAVARVPVTSITYRDLDLTRHGQGHSVHVVFGYSRAPWWVDQMDMTANIEHTVFVAA